MTAQELVEKYGDRLNYYLKSYCIEHSPSVLMELTTMIDDQGTINTLSMYMKTAVIMKGAEVAEKELIALCPEFYFGDCPVEICLNIDDYPSSQLAERWIEFKQEIPVKIEKGIAVVGECLRECAGLNNLDSMPFLSIRICVYGKTLKKRRKLMSLLLERYDKYHSFQHKNKLLILTDKRAIEIIDYGYMNIEDMLMKEIASRRIALTHEGFVCLPSFLDKKSMSPTNLKEISVQKYYNVGINDSCTRVAFMASLLFGKNYLPIADLHKYGSDSYQKGFNPKYIDGDGPSDIFLGKNGYFIAMYGMKQLPLLIFLDGVNISTSGQNFTIYLHSIGEIIVRRRIAMGMDVKGGKLIDNLLNAELDSDPEIIYDDTRISSSLFWNINEHDNFERYSANVVLKPYYNKYKIIQLIIRSNNM